MVSTEGPSVHQLFDAQVRHLDPEQAVFEAMLVGWATQQQARQLKRSTIQARTYLIRRFAAYTNDYPWQWSSTEAEEFFATLSASTTPSTVRSHQAALRLFLAYLVDPNYEWIELCQKQFGAVPRQILHDWNSYHHVTEFEGHPSRRPLSYDEVQALFDAADGLAKQARSFGRKGAATAQRDAVVLKTVYAFGLRRRELWGLDLADLRANPQIADYGRLGAVFIRWGKSSKGSPPKRRTVLLVPEMDWLVPAVNQWLDELRPAFGAQHHPALWLTERLGRMSMRSINRAFQTAREAAGLPEELDLHSLRHSYVTHLIEFDYPEKFVQDQVGHEYASTTAIYSGVSDEYRLRMLQRSLTRDRYRWEGKP